MIETIEMRAIPHWQRFLQNYDRPTLLNMSIHHLKRAALSPRRADSDLHRGAARSAREPDIPRAKGFLDGKLRKASDRGA